MQVRCSNGFEDHQLKCDVFLITKFAWFPRIPIQIKSSQWYADLFKERFPKIPVVVVTERDTPKQIRQNTMRAIVATFPEIRKAIESSGCALPS